jgi:hypothetical protein
VSELWKMPDPPGPTVRSVRDVEGVEWHRSNKAGDLWKDGTGDRVSWDRLIYEMGPLTADEVDSGGAP